jgi:type I restriction enzyme R subunit
MRDALPNASFIGFTGTPIELSDKNTRAVFGDYISVYDIQQAVEDGATVPIYYESRLAKLQLSDEERPKPRRGLRGGHRGRGVEGKEKLKSRSGRKLEALVGTEQTARADRRGPGAPLRGRVEVLDGKAMVVCMSRRICVELYKAIVALRPEWHTRRRRGRDQGRHDRLGVGPGRLAAAHPQQGRREALAKRFKQPDDPFKIVIVRDMWLTGFDAPCAAHDVRRQAHAGPRADAGHRAGEPRVSRTSRAASSWTTSASPTS